MRKARYLATLAGLIMATAVAAGSAAYAGTAPAGAAPSAHTVTVNVGPAVAGDCIGKIRAHTDHNHEGLTFWYKKDWCIGTVQTVTYVAAAGKCANPQLRIYGNGKLVFKSWAGFPGPKEFFCPVHGLLRVKATWTVRQIFVNPVRVRATAEIKGGHGILGPAQVTVNK
jgi:hypothetical protein